jgi:hypothetical protein
VNQTYCGHGINQQFHCAPNVPVRFPLPFPFFAFLLYLTLDLERNERGGLMRFWIDSIIKLIELQEL